MIKKNIRLFIGILIGGIVFGSIGVYAASKIYASSVSVDTTNMSTLGASSDVNATLNYLYSQATKVDSWIDTDLIDFGTLTVNKNKSIFASSVRLCTKINNKVACFKPNNFDIEKNHIKQVFSETNCNDYGSYVSCYGYNFDCTVTSYVYCSDRTTDTSSYCKVYSTGEVLCT